MIKALMGCYRRSPEIPAIQDDATVAEEMRRRRWSVFLSITIGYGFYYVCRLTLGVIKTPVVEAGIFDAGQLGLIGSAAYFSYAFGKLANGVLADRVNVRRFMATGLLVSAAVNLALGFTTAFWVFVLLWGINGWFQSFGAPSSVVSISHWFSNKQRGSFYGVWSTSHNIGEAITWIVTGIVVAKLGWVMGLRMAGILGIIMGLLILRFLYERPEVYGLPGVVRAEPQKSIGAKQWQVIRNPAVWILAFASAFFYVTRYAVNSWGVFFLEADKGYTLVEASGIISVNAVAGIFGTFFSGILSDRLFAGRRNVPALLFGVLYTISIALFVFAPANPVLDSVSMVLFGIALGALLVYLGGLMAVDICSKEASGTALGVIGVASYLGAGFQDIISGYLIEGSKVMVDGQEMYDFNLVGMFWVGSAVVSLLLAALVWNVKSPEEERE